MSANEIHLNDIGTIFEVTVMDGTTVVDVSGATTKQFIFRKPDGSLLTKTAVLSSGGTDGKLKYTTVTGDLDAQGIYGLQVYVVLPTGSWRSDVQQFEVYGNL